MFYDIITHLLGGASMKSNKLTKGFLILLGGLLALTNLAFYLNDNLSLLIVFGTILVALLMLALFRIFAHQYRRFKNIGKAIERLKNIKVKLRNNYDTSSEAAPKRRELKNL